MNDLSNEVVVITGAVGNLGLAAAHAVHRLGARSVLMDRSSERLKNLFPELAGKPDHLLLGETDGTSEASIAGAMQQVYAHFGKLTALVNTVGGFRGGKPVHEESLDTWDFLMNLNLRTTLLACRAVTPYMIRGGRGRIVNVASRNALSGSGNYAAYSAAKAAVLRLTESLSEELKGSNINVNCVIPGTIDTPQNRQSMPGADVSRFVAPEAIADVIAFLLSDAARAVTGAALPIYGKG